MSDATSPLSGLTTLLQLERSARAAKGEKQLQFLMVNQTLKLIEYHQAILWKITPTGKLVIAAVSGLSDIDPHAPFIRWLTEQLAQYTEQTEPCIVNKDDLTPAEQKDWLHWTSGQIAVCPLIDHQGRKLGGLWLSRDSRWQDPEIATLLLLLDAYVHAWSGWIAHKKTIREAVQSGLKKQWGQLALVLGFCVLGFMPVSLTVVAPAEVVAIKPYLIASPLDGVIKQFFVQPNAQVAQGDRLFSLDETRLKNDLVISRKALAVAQVEYLKATRKAFSDAKSKGDIALLKAQKAQKKAEVDYAEAQLERIQITAPQDGIVIFNDINDWLGKPVITGEKVLVLAQAEKVELSIQLAVADAINLASGASVQLFLNTAPTAPLDLTLQRSAYSAQVNADGILAFELRALFSHHDKPRIGLRGTAKLYGEKVTLFYYLFRRPLASLRQWFAI